MSNYPPSDSEGWGYNPDPNQHPQQGADPYGVPPGSDPNQQAGGGYYGQGQQPYGQAPTPWPGEQPAHQQDPAVSWGAQPNQYGAPGNYNQYVVQSYPRNSQATAALVLSLFSVFLCCLPLSIPGMIMGKIEMNAIDDGRTDPANRSSALIAFIVGLIITGINLAILGFYVVVLVLAGVSAGA